MIYWSRGFTIFHCILLAIYSGAATVNFGNDPVPSIIIGAALGCAIGTSIFLILTGEGIT